MTLHESEKAQTFGFDGSITLDRLFELVEERNRFTGESFMSIALNEHHRVFRLSINRNEADEAPQKTISELVADMSDGR